MNRAAISRADLIRCAASLDDDCLGRLADSLGYKKQPAAPAVGRAGGALIEPPASMVRAQAQVPTFVGERRPHHQYRIVERRQLAPRPTTPAPQPIPEPAPRVAPLGPPPPLIPWPRLWPFLRTALGIQAERHRIDLRRVVTTAARLQPLRWLPRVKGLHWAPRGQLVLDLSRRLYPFWNDFHAIRDQIECLRGASGLEVLRLDRGPDGPVQPWEGEVQGWGAPRPYRLPPAGAPVLIAGDLGCLGPAAETRPWVQLGRRLAAHGCRAVVLTPCPPRWWAPTLAGLYFPVTLERTAHLPPVPAGPLPWPTSAPDLAAERERDEGARRLLTLLSPCIAITPPLIRHLRYLLPAGLADVGSEAIAWQHPAFIGGDHPLVPGDQAKLATLRHAFPTTGTVQQRRLAWELILAQQESMDCSVAVRLEERALYAAMLGGRDAAAEAFFDRTGTALQQARVHRTPGNVRALTDWVNRRAVRTHPALWDLSPASVRLWLDAHPEAETGEAVLPPGLDIHRALSARGRPPQYQSWRLVQRGNRLEIEPAAAPAQRLTSGSPLGTQLHTNLPVIAAREEHDDAPWRSLGLNRNEGGGGVAALALGDTGWRLRTDYEELVIAPMERPAWAQTLGRDGDGLFVGFKDGQGERRAYWCAPLEWLGWPGSPTRPEASPWDGHGCFIDHDQYQAVRARGLAPEGAGLSLHSDRFGLRAEIAIEGVPIGLRWLWPGAFLMGSPETEQDRYDRETRHQVILTRGFWLAETACTQALWQAVMGENPSYFKGPQRPVEQVSWEDVRRFIERLNIEQARSAQRTLRFRLPTEAEWEYACRAGTATAYSFGNDFDPKRANNGGETVAVRSLPPNPWGLYEMHGNVDEWCQDWFGDYSTGPVVDPQGPESGEGRVLRGGSWFNEARNLRSAYRSLFDPGNRSQDIGFRLALGPEPSREARDGRPAGSGAGLPAPGASGSERKARAVRSRGGRGGHGK